MNQLTAIERENQRVMTTAVLAEEYGTTERRISENFNANKERYVEGKHFYCLMGDALRDFRANTEITDLPLNINKLYLWTQKGALLHAKSLGTDRAWEVYDILVESYFTKNEYELMFNGLSQEMKAIMLQDKKVQAVENRVNKLENTMTINHEQQREITNLKSQRVMAICNGYKSVVYNTISGEVFRALGHDYKEYFKINAYGNTPVAKIDEAKAYIRNWQPSNNLQIEINRVSKEAFEDKAS